MKKALLLVALLATVGVAQAKDVAYIANKDGGAIILTDRLCNGRDTSNGMVVYARGNGGKTSFGCWFYQAESNFVGVGYSDGNTYTYPVRGFTFYDDKK
jgi:hypothetical protein